MDLSSIEQIIRTQVPNAPDSDVELYLDSVQRDMKFGGDYSDMSEDDIVEDFEFYIQSKMDESQKPSMKMKKSELKEMIKAAFLYYDITRTTRQNGRSFRNTYYRTS
jgi:hypothetical protein